MFLPSWIVSKSRFSYGLFTALYFSLCFGSLQLLAQTPRAQTELPGLRELPRQEPGLWESHAPDLRIESDPQGSNEDWRKGWAESPTRTRVFHATVDDLSWRLRRNTWRERSLFGASGPRLVAWDERYVDSRDRGWGAETGFEQNRTFAGLAWWPNDSQRSRIEFGYLNQEWDDPGSDDRRFHFFSLNFYY